MSPRPWHSQNSVLQGSHCSGLLLECVKFGSLLYSTCKIQISRIESTGGNYEVPDNGGHSKVF